MYKTIKIHDKEFNAFIDIDSQFNILREDTYKKIKSPVLSKSTLRFSSFGRNEVKPIGYFKDKIEIDGFHVTVYVGSNDVMTIDIVIGNELLS